MASEKVVLKSEELWELPEDGKIHEIINGEHTVSKAPSITHQRIVAKLFTLIQKQIEQGEVILSPTGLILDDENGIIPDLMIISDKKSKIIKHRGVFGSPDWIIEILSPHNKESDLVTKKAIYQRNKVDEYWCVDPERERIHVFRLENNYEEQIKENDGTTKIRSNTFDIELDVANIFDIKTAM